MIAPHSPWITMYLVDPRYKPVGASDPGSAKSSMPVTSSILSYTLTEIMKDHEQIKVNTCTEQRKKRSALTIQLN